ncbi:hypothetical protein ANO14919_025910 [Xylariales sp. No.14919]|nr:hypothetical protein ANO14919_025910 [Xylariales sp. No.14919]
MMVTHTRTTLRGTDNPVTSFQRVLPENDVFRIDARSREADTETRKKFRREAMKHTDALFPPGGLFASADAPRPPPPPDPPVPNPQPPNEH